MTKNIASGPVGPVISVINAATACVAAMMELGALALFEPVGGAQPYVRTPGRLARLTRHLSTINLRYARVCSQRYRGCGPANRPCAVACSELCRRPRQQFPVVALLLPVHQDVQVLRRLLA